MKIPKFYALDTQMCVIGRHEWSVARLIELSKSLPITEAKLDHLNVWHKYEGLSLRQMVMHIKAIQDADLACPIILDEDGELMDGRHRLMKAMLEGRDTIKVVRFDENPDPCRIKE